MKIAQITDLHLDDFLAEKFRIDSGSNFSNIVAEVVSRRIAYVVLTGDLGIPAKNRWIADKLASNGVQFDVVLGNHDRIDQFRTSGLLQRDSVSETEYFYSHQFLEKDTIFLDTGSGVVSSSQLNWLDKELPSGKGDVLLFCHHPLLDCGTAMDKSMALSNRSDVEELLRKSGRSVQIYCGHYHSAQVVRSGNIRQFVTPATIMQVRSEGSSIVTDSFDFGFRVIEISEHSISNEVVMFKSERMVAEGE